MVEPLQHTAEWVWCYLLNEIQTTNPQSGSKTRFSVCPNVHSSIHASRGVEHGENLVSHTFLLLTLVDSVTQKLSEFAEREHRVAQR